MKESTTFSSSVRSRYSIEMKMSVAATLLDSRDQGT